MAYKHCPNFCGKCGYAEKTTGVCKRYKLCAKWVTWFNRKWRIIQRNFKEIKEQNNG